MNVVEQLRKEEGSVPHAYTDSLGYWTIGVGRLIDKRKGGGLSEEEIAFLLANDVKRVTKEVERALPWVVSLNEPRAAVLIGMAFQMGLKGLLGFKNTLEFIRTGEYSKAAAGMLQSKWAKQTPARVQRMAKQMETGEWT